MLFHESQRGISRSDGEESGKLPVFLDVVKGLETVLGSDYLQKLKMRLGRRSSEIIISEEIKPDMEKP